MKLEANPAVHGVIDISQTDVKGRITTIPYLDAPTETSCKSFIKGIGSLIGNSVSETELGKKCQIGFRCDLT